MGRKKSASELTKDQVVKRVFPKDAVKILKVAANPKKTKKS